jgi:hypothetical protein
MVTACPVFLSQFYKFPRVINHTNYISSLSFYKYIPLRTFSLFHTMQLVAFDVQVAKFQGTGMNECPFNNIYLFCSTR